jgi:hypothetical protein
MKCRLVKENQPSSRIKRRYHLVTLAPRSITYHITDIDVVVNVQEVCPPVC